MFFFCIDATNYATGVSSFLLVFGIFWLATPQCLQTSKNTIMHSPQKVIMFVLKRWTHSF